MNYSKIAGLKKFASSRNRPLTTKQKIAFERNLHKLSIESFCNIKKLKRHNKKILEIGFGSGDILLNSAISNPDNLETNISILFSLKTSILDESFVNSFVTNGNIIFIFFYLAYNY